MRWLTQLADELPAQRATLREGAHRPWPLPQRRWLMGQTWHDLLFAHWPVDPGLLRAHLPQPLELDVRDGVAWLGITPFWVAGLRGCGTPPLPWLSTFPELNVRTYASCGGRPGIYFLSLDAGRKLAVAAARRSYRLPYFHARMEIARTGARIEYSSERIDSAGAPAAWRASYGPAGDLLPVANGSLERWLAERYCLYVVDERHRPLRANIHHPPWPLQPAWARIDANTMARPYGIEPQGEPLLHYSHRQDTVIWPLEPA
ncbi:MAG TPA: DUF2071 domain-containing protein [Thermoleophilaceae bacterium]|nr:DUF2071 domain-containing protein [Thermoleophilaceae bacterium]